MISAGNLRSLVWGLVVAAIGLLGVAPTAHAQKVDGIDGREANAAVNLQLTPTNAFVRIRGWSLPAPLLPLSVMGQWGGQGVISGDGTVHIPVGNISQPASFEFPRDINGETETMIVSLSARSDWTGTVNPLNGEMLMNMPMTLRIEAHHVRMVDIPWPGGWIYGNIDCTVPLEFSPMTSYYMAPPVPGPEVPPVTEGKAYDPATGTATVVNNSMSIGGFHCTHPDIGAGKVEDELNGAVAIPSGPGATDSRFNLTFPGDGTLKPQPAIRPAFPSTPAGPGAANLDGSASHVAAGVDKYRWDFNADGIADLATKQPTTRHDFGAPGTYEVGLSVSDRDGDVSGWKAGQVKTGTTDATGPGSAGLVLKVKRPKKAAPGSRAKLLVTVTNRSTRSIKKLKLCVKAKKHLAKGRGCKAKGKLGAGASKRIKLRVKLTRKAGSVRTLNVRLVAKAPGVKQGRAITKIRISKKNS